MHAYMLIHARNPNEMELYLSLLTFLAIISYTSCYLRSFNHRISAKMATVIYDSETNFEVEHGLILKHLGDYDSHFERLH